MRNFKFIDITTEFVLSEEVKGVSDMLDKNEMEELESAIRSALIARKAELNLSDDAMGRMAYGFMKNPRGKIQALLVGQGAADSRKPQQMRLGDLINMCEAVGLQWVEEARTALKVVKKK